MARNPERRASLVDAAIEVLARDGARGLTFRAVDAQAEVPVGTVSNYFANRDDMFNQVGQQIHMRLEPSAAELAAASQVQPSRELAIEQLQALFGRITRDRPAYLALLELRLEATRRPELQAMLTETIRANHERDVQRHLEFGMPGDRTTVLLLYLAMSGLVVEYLTLPGTLSPRTPEDVVADIVTQLMPDSR